MADLNNQQIFASSADPEDSIPESKEEGKRPDINMDYIESMWDAQDKFRLMAWGLR